MPDPILLKEVEELNLYAKEFENYILTRAMKVVQATPNGVIDKTYWLVDAIELAHAVYRSWRDSRDEA